MRAVGVSNYSAKETRSMDAALRKRGLRLASNQIEFSLLRAMPLRVGLIGTCRELGVVPAGLLAHRAGTPDRQVLGGQPAAPGPLVLGPPHGRGGHRSSRCCGASARPTATAPRARWRWPGSSPRARVPIPGAKNREQAEQNAGALGWRLTDEELDLLTQASLYGTRTLQQRIWQHG